MDGFVDGFAVEEHLAECGAELLVGDFAVAADFLGDGVVGFEVVEVLIVVADVEVCAPADFPGVGVAEAEDDFEEGGFTGAVGSDDAKALAAFEFQGEVVPEFVGVGFCEFADGEDAVAGALFGFEGDVDFLVGADGLDEGVGAEETLEAFFAAGGLAGALVGAEAADVFGLFFDVGLLEVVGALLGEFSELALLDEGGVVAGVAFEAGVDEPDDAGGDAIEEVAIVADDEDGAGVVGEIIFQPGDGGEI